MTVLNRTASPNSFPYAEVYEFRKTACAGFPVDWRASGRNDPAYIRCGSVQIWTDTFFLPLLASCLVRKLDG